ncbi:MAG: sigma-70 family RNA polymerase sigma factor [Actinomycetota bacterium]
MRSKLKKSVKRREDLEDARLLEEIANGDQACLSILYDRYAGSAFGLAWKICNSRAIAEDVVQEAFMAVWQRPGSFDSGRGSAGSFLLGIVHHKAVDAVRKEESVRRREANFAADLSDSSGDEILDAAWLTIRRQTVVRALRQLSDVQREALELAYLHGLTYSEVAARLRIPLGTAKTRMRDGLIKLRDILDESAVT